MKKTLFSVLFTLALCLAVLPASAQEDVYTLLGPDGQAVTQYMGECEAGDEYISGDNLHYRVVSVDPQAKTAQLELLGDADMPDVSWLEMEQSLAVSATNNRKIALYCTHSDESYIEGDGTESDEERGGIYDVAAAFGEGLEELGVSVTLSDATHHPHDAGAYRRSRQTAVELLKDGPSAIFDIHRDGIPDPDEYATTIGNEKMSKVRLLVGKSNPNADANRKFAKQIKATADEMYPDLIKDIYIGKGDYNQELAPRAILLEFGTHTIKKERAIKSTDYMADVLERVLFGSTAKAEGAANADADAAGSETTAEAGGSGAAWGILWVVGIALAAIVGYGLITTGSFSGMWNKVKRGASETTGGLLGKKRGEREK